MQDTLRGLLAALRDGTMSVDDALAHLRGAGASDIPSVTLDHLRAERTGFPEVIYCPGKRDDEIAAIAARLASSAGRFLATRATASAFEAVRAQVPDARFDADARAIAFERDRLERVGLVCVVSAGTSDRHVAAEAACALDIMGNELARVDDVGVAGLHRVLGHVGALRTCNVVVAVAGMDGALPGVIAGLTDRPVLAVPTSVGYGASFAGLAALLTMLNACAGGVSVVNIDNGFGAACAASRINHLAADRAKR
ncbi:MAG: nickel pincer cofactor biosynthesis protein LarB [Candidatus Eremiobacteraeota bacterium]|nr:nickel pincer cofactor biosynthesis protein LarB [Candidatus Eremiobacteraeota bacterium]